MDSLAADALVALERDGSQARWDGDSRSAWTRFILSLLLRCPEDIESLRNWWRTEFTRTDSKLEARYQSRRKDVDPPTFSDFLARRPTAEIEKHQFEMLFKLIDNQKIGSTINQMHWHVIVFPDNSLPLMTSDRPIIRTNGILQENGHIALPIGPRKLFIAANTPGFIRRLDSISKTQLAKEVNRNVTQHAVKFVYALDDGNIEFVKKHFGSRRQPRLIDLITNSTEFAPPVELSLE